MTKFWYKLFKLILKPIYKFYYNPQIYGKENLSIDGPLIIAGNHIHLMDQCNIIISTKKIITFMAKKEYFDSWKTKWFFKMVGCISVNRGSKTDTSKEDAIKVLKQNGIIGIFPEGTRNKSKEKLLPFKTGAVSMSVITNAYIIPFAIVGDYKFRSKTLKIKFGKQFKPINMTVEEANDYLYNEISKMIDELKQK